MTPEALFDLLWNDYSHRLCPSALKVQALLQEDAPLINDHIAIRTFNLSPVRLEILAHHFIALGYEEKGNYQFEAKKLVAKHFEHPNPLLPRVFISELEVEKFSFHFLKIIHALVSQVDEKQMKQATCLFYGRPWEVSIEQYLILAGESEYAAWVAAHGYGANHFTVSVNQLSRFHEVAEVNQFLKQHQFVMNTSGGEVKGNPSMFLEQSSTMADRVGVSFEEGELYVPGGYYEFAKRYPLDNGQLYGGFVMTSADKIFESTHQEQAKRQ